MFLDKTKDLLAYDIFNRVAALRASGKTVHSLAIGEPSFDTPPGIIRAAHASMLRGETHYGPALGSQMIREVVSEKVRRKNGIRATVKNSVFITTKLGVFAALAALSEPGYEVLVPDPGYYYSDPVTITGGRPVPYALADDFDLDIGEVRRRIGKRTRALVLNTPSNPCGRLIGWRRLKELLDTCRENSITIISDESYEDLVYQGKHVSIGSMEEAPDAVVSIFSLSKSYAMTGWRAGYTVAHERLVRLISRFLENAVTCYPLFIERASAYAIRNCDGDIRRFRRELRARLRLLEEMMESIPSLEYQKTEGTFYAFPRYRKRTGSIPLTRALLREQGVAVLPGRAFGPSGEGHIRLSFGAPRPEIRSAMQGIQAYFNGDRVSAKA